ncbi:hypothetical protein ACFU8W_42910 [Streptomyces sp. NPDC057565]|uniref:hypothetical protein n=1 Tax=Streptomyces sp. NPDC057565 TaxID=3346169 RepID=UPI0036B5CC46
MIDRRGRFPRGGSGRFVPGVGFGQAELQCHDCVVGQAALAGFLVVVAGGDLGGMGAGDVDVVEAEAVAATAVPGVGGFVAVQMTEGVGEASGQEGVVEAVR